MSQSIKFNNNTYVDATGVYDSTYNKTQSALNTSFTNKKISISLPTASWTGDASPYSQTITVTGSTANSKVDLQADSTIINQLISDGTNALYTQNNNGTISVIAVGSKPSVNLTLQGVVSEVAV